MIKHLVLLALMPVQAAACDHLMIHGASWHSDRDLLGDRYELNEANFGLGCRVDDVFEIGSLTVDVEGGAYNNSLHQLSVYGLTDITASNGLGVFVGRASGYGNELHVEGLIAGGVHQGKHVTTRVSPTYNNTTGQWGYIVGLSLDIPL